MENNKPQNPNAKRTVIITATQEAILRALAKVEWGSFTVFVQGSKIVRWEHTQSQRVEEAGDPTDPFKDLNVIDLSGD